MVNVYKCDRHAWEEGALTEGGHTNTLGGVWTLKPEAKQVAEHSHALDLPGPRSTMEEVSLAVETVPLA